MTDTLNEVHAQQGLAALVANPNLLGVYDGFLPGTPPASYVMVHTSVSWPRDGIGTALNATQVTITTTYTCHCVALSAAGTRAVDMQVRSSLLNFRPVIAGRNCSPIKQSDAQPPDRDESTGRPVFASIAVYDFTSTG